MRTFGDWNRPLSGRPLFGILTLVGVIASVLLGSFFDVWWGTDDDGVFAHVAERIHAGEVYGVEVQEIHGGYQNFLNALMFEWFSFDVAVLRYPLVVLGVVQAVLLAYLVRRQGALASLLLGVASPLLGYLVLPMAAPAWYCLFFAVLMTFILQEFRITRTSLLMVGCVIGLAFMFRHPNALFLGMGATLYLMAQAPIGGSTIANAWRYVVLGLMTLLIGIFAWISFEPTAALFFLLPALVVVQWFMNEPQSSRWVVQVGWVLGGAVVAVLPMVVYQLAVGDVGLWVRSAFFSSAALSTLGVLGEYRYVDLILAEFSELRPDRIVPIVLKAGSWTVLLGLPLFLVGMMSRSWQKGGLRSLPPIAFIAPLYGVAAVYYQIPFYFFAVAILYVLAFFLVVPSQAVAREVRLGVFAFVLVAVSLFQVPGITDLHVPTRHIQSTVPRNSLSITTEINALQTEVVSYIRENSPAGSAIFSFPLDPHLYFHSERRNPFPFIGTAFAVDVGGAAGIIATLERTTPALIVHTPGHTYHTSMDDALVEWLERSDQYEPAERIERYQFYRYTGANTDS